MTVRTTETAKEVRKTIKKLGYSAKQVSVRKDGGSVKVNIKALEASKNIDKIEAAVKVFEHYRTDDFSGEILSGGNTFVFVGIDWEFADKVIDGKREEIENVNIDWVDVKKHNIIGVFEFLEKHKKQKLSKQ